MHISIKCILNTILNSITTLTQPDLPSVCDFLGWLHNILVNPFYCL